MLAPNAGNNRTQGGFTLIELMIALVIGLIVVGATFALVTSLLKANNDTIKSTRLTQELRAVADIITTEVRRARSLEDPLADVGVGAAAFTTCNAVYPAATDGVKACLLFAYGCNPNDGTGQFKMVRLQQSNLIVASSTTASLTCATGGTQLNSTDVVIDQADFASTAAGAVQMTVKGHLASDAALIRSVTRTVWPRSVAVAP